MPTVAAGSSSARSRLRTWTLRLLLVAASVFATLVIGGGLDARRRHPELKPWHRLVPSDEMTASSLTEAVMLPGYLQHEAAVFDQVRRDVELQLADSDRTATNRYNPAGASSPSRLPHDDNRTFEVTPDDIRGGALLVHGLTDSPYSMRAIAACLQGAGYYSLALRMPGHGGVPGGLTRATWQDWMAAVRLGVRHVRGRIGPSKPLILVGYSNGGALVVKYTLDQLDAPGNPRPDRLLLVSPMIGVTPFARLSSVISALSPIPYFDRAAWLDVLPEYNPFKFNSFPANAARQTYDLTRAISEALEQQRNTGGLARFPPVLTFQSLVDATVSTDAVVNTLYASLPSNGSELVLFDLNRSARLDPFIRPSDRALLGTLFDRHASRLYTVTIISNVSSSTAEVAEWRVAAGTTTVMNTPLRLVWPGDVFSLSHIAMPFRSDDPVYGIAAPQSPTGPIRLGILAPRGERSVLTVPIDTLMRVSYNPFFPYVEGRTRGWVDH